MLNQNIRRTWCTVLLLINLKAPEWVLMNCSAPVKYIKTCVCSFDNHGKTLVSKDNTHSEKKFCSPEMLKIGSACFEVLWNENYKTIFPGSVSPNIKVVTDNSLQSFESKLLYNLANILKLTPILLCESINCSSVKTFHHNPFNNTYTFKDHSNYEGYKLLQMPATVSMAGGNVFKCLFGPFISILQLCIKAATCHTDLYKEFCICKQKSKTHKCCPMLFFANKQNKCSMYYIVPHAQQKFNNTFSKPSVSDANEFSCRSNIKLVWDMVDDLVPDCRQAEDETILQSIVINNTKTTCKNKNQIHCHYGHPNCFNVTDICKFKLNRYFHTVPCRNAAHLQNCRLFQCNILFKCPEYYCIPWVYVCNSRWDCPKGTDEAQNWCISIQMCKSMFKCSKGCIHLNSVCDGHADCLDFEDEQLCELGQLPCPNKCKCLVLGMMCKEFSISLSSNVPFVFVHFQNIHLFQVNIFQNLPFLFIAQLFNLSLTDICQTIPAKDLSVLIAIFNNIPFLENNCFVSNKHMSRLQLSFNKITHVSDGTFTGLSDLHLVNLSHNDLQTLSLKFVHKSLDVLSLTRNPLQDISSDIFEIHPPKSLETNDFRICCLLSMTSQCKYANRGYFSCDNLLPCVEIEVSSWVIAAMVTILNTLSIIFHLIWRNRSKSNTVLIAGLSLAEMLQAVYLFALSIANVTFGERFVLKQGQWTSSLVCLLSSTVGFDFTLSSTGAHVLVSISRLMLVLHPVNTKFKRAKFVGKSTGSLHLLTFLLSATVCSIFFLFKRFFPNSLCSIFVDNNVKSFLFCKVSALLLLCLHLTASICQIAMSILLVNKYKDSQKNLTKNKSGQTRPMTVKLVTTALSNTLCWFGTDIVVVTALFLPEYPTEMLVWTVIMLSSTTAIVTPLLVVISLLASVWKDYSKA